LGVTLLSMASPRCHAQTPVRKSIRTMMQDTDLWQSFISGVAKMKQRSEDDPNDRRGWLYQANIHGTPFLSSDELLNQCDHGSIQFIVWHRAYLFYFEEILREASGNDQVYLPYWEWDVEAHRSIPTPYYLVDALSHPRLMSSPSMTLANDDAQGIAAVDTPSFFGSNGVATNQLPIGFGGLLPGTSFGPGIDPGFANFLRKGFCEALAHDRVHGAVGGDMADPRTAARDTIFWSHHCQVDRLYESWIAKHGTSQILAIANEIDAEWKFVDSSDTVVTKSFSDVLFSNQLGFAYDELVGVTPEESLLAAAPAVTEEAGSAVEESETEEVTINVRPTVLSSETVNVSLGESLKAVAIPLQSDAHVESALVESDEPEASVFLVAKSVEFNSVPSGVFEVYLRMQQEVAPTGDPRESATYAGSISLFGIPALGEMAHHGGHASGDGDHDTSRSVAVDITKAVRQFKTEDEWDKDRLEVIIFPRGPVVDGKARRLILKTPVEFKGISIQEIMPGDITLD
ncbi:MAG: tyrosinase family protein, partial [Planctomycetota bacterium]